MYRRIASDVTFNDVIFIRHFGRHGYAIKMVNTCCVVGCANRHGRDEVCSFFKLPKVITHQGKKARELSERRRTEWLAKINRKDWLLVCVFCPLCLI